MRLIGLLFLRSWMEWIIEFDFLFVWIKGCGSSHCSANKRENKSNSIYEWNEDKPSSTTTKEQRKSNQQTRVASWAQRLFWFASLLGWVVGRGSSFLWGGLWAEHCSAATSPKRRLAHANYLPFSKSMNGSEIDLWLSAPSINSLSWINGWWVMNLAPVIHSTSLLLHWFV